MKPNDLLIESYEHFVLGNSEELKATQMLKVTVSRCKLINILSRAFKTPTYIFAGRNKVSGLILNLSNLMSVQTL